ncbi:DUF4350 domain-containing protein [Pseudactinotalea sp. Z1739]|uniref:DUF4350 domain-containing protein n=1 Tax=Pseudactinotalea sp. Z1739 TaxID=3413028 RepID=UPI003C7C28C4
MRTSRTRTGLTWGLGIAGAITLIAALAWISPSASSSVAYAPNNPNADGARAAAQILGDQGVHVRYVRTTSAALADAREDGTLLIVNAHRLRPEQQEALAQAPGDVVLAGTGPQIDRLTERVGHHAGGTRDVHEAQCGDEHARAADRIGAGGPQVTGGDGVELCFGDTPETGRYAAWTQDGATWRVLSTPEILRNDALAEHGNAALVLRSLGHYPHLTWYVPSPGDDFGEESLAAATTLPLLRPPMLAMYAVLALALILWRGRRLGPVISEPLPVAVRAAETTRGRGRLYRRNKTHAHAGTALRAGTVARVSGKLGLARWAQRDDVVLTISRATGRTPDQIDSVLYGPPPHDEASLAALAEALDTMESEVHRR